MAPPRWLSRFLALFRRSAPSAAPQAGFRRLKRAELERLGFSPKSERYVTVGKKITKRTRTLSRRQYDNIRRGGMTEYQQNKALKPVSEKKYTGNAGGTFDEKLYSMPLNRTAFNIVLAKIQKRYSTAKGDVVATPIVETDGKVATGSLRFLRSVSFDDVVQTQIMIDTRYSKSGPSGPVRKIWLKIREYP